MRRIADLEHRIRGIRAAVNKSSIVFQLLRKKGVWNRVCSAMDMLGDTEIALESWEHSTNQDDLGMRYVTIFGVLQILVVQQDAAKHLSAAFEVSTPEDAERELSEIKEIRNSSTGHPVLRDRKQGSSHHITRATLSTKGFEMMSYWPNGESRYSTVNLIELVARQAAILAPLLDKALQKAIAMENEHRQRFRGDSLASMINRHILQNLWQAVHDADRAPMGPSSIGMIRDNIDAFERGLLARMPTSRPDEDLRLVRHALSRLENYFQLPVPTEMERADADIFACYVMDRLERTREFAKEVDSRFEREPATTELE